jgi:hypothetical protein
VLRPIGPDIWVADRPFKIPFGDIGVRMTVIRLADGGLWIHSPVKLDAATREAIDELGPVRAIVAPNLQHHLYVGDYFAAYPEAAIHAAPGLERKRDDLAFHAVLSDEAPAAWRGQIEQRFFAGASILNEVVFFHPASRTLLLTDLAFNVPAEEAGRARLFYWISGGAGRFGPHRIVRLGIRDKKSARRSVEAILDWDFDRATVAHGHVQETGAKDKVRAAFAYLFDRAPRGEGGVGDPATRP